MVKVEGISLWPDLISGEKFLARVTKNVKSGDLVIFEGDGRKLIKKVIFAGNNFIITKDNFNNFYIVKRDNICGKILKTKWTRSVKE